MKSKFYTAKSSEIILSLLTVFAIVFLCVCTSEAGVAEVFFGRKTRKVPVYSVATEEKVVALSFDSAYGAEKTSGIMDILDEYGVKSTFFLVGFWVKNYPEKVKEIDARGFEIGTHSNVHAYMSKMTAGDIRGDLEASVEKITALTGKEVKLFRPPYGDYNDTLVEVGEDMGLLSVQWSVDSLDWKNDSKDAIVRRVKAKLHPGAIVLMHNNSDYVLDALPEILQYIRGEGYKVVPVGELVHFEDYYVDNNGVQHRNK